MLANADPFDQFSEVCKFYEENSDKDICILNSPGLKFGTVVCYLNSSKALKDFYMQEVQVCTKTIDRGNLENFNLGFMGQGGKEGLANRSIFTEFFIYESLQDLFLPMYNIMKRNFAQFVKKNNISSNQFHKVNINDFLTDFMIDMNSLILFGFQSASELNIDMTKYPEITKLTLFTEAFGKSNQENLLKIIQLYVGISMKILFDPFNLIFSGWPHRLGLKEIYRDQKAIKSFIEILIFAEYEKRYQGLEKNTTMSPSKNIIDLMCEHNYKCFQNNNTIDILSKDIIVGNIIAFAFAAVDTSLQASTNGLMHIAQNYQDYFNKIEFEGLKSLSEIKNNHTLELVIKEILRIYNPASTSFQRILQKDIKVAGVTLKKGFYIGIPVSIKKWNKKYGDAREFRPERFETEIDKLEKYEYSPFIDGKRKCIGYNLAEMNLKLMIGYLVNM